MSQYAQIQDIEDYGLPPTAISSLGPDQLNAALIAASGKADSYLQSRFALPLLQWGLDLTETVCAIASYRVLRRRGFKPGTSNNDEVWKIDYDDAIKWLTRVQDGKVKPQGIMDSRPPSELPTGDNTNVTPQPQIFTLQPQVGSAVWGQRGGGDNFWGDAPNGNCGGGVGPPVRRGWGP